MQKRTKIIISDLHIGGGHQKGRPNFYDDFKDDYRFEKLIAKLGEQFESDDLELIINGDFYDLLKVPVNGLFPEAITESVACLKLELAVRGHPKVTEALKSFLRGKHRRITYQPGNHDMEVVFPSVRHAFCRALTGKDSDERIRFITDRDHYRLEGGVEIHHGHQFEALNAFDFRQLVLERGKSAEPILNLPWGSLFVLQVVNKFKEERPYLDRVKPFWPLIVGGVALDTGFTVRASLNAVYYFVRARVSPLWHRRRPFTKITKFLMNELNLFEKHEDTAQRLFRNDPSLRALIMGHTHTEMVRTYGRGERIYINTGTWVPMVNLSPESLGQSTEVHYALVRYTDRGDPRVSLMRWFGRRPQHEEVFF